MALSITVNGGGTFSASMEEGPVSFTASLGAVPGPKGDTGATGATGVVAATAPITYDSGTQTVGISATPTFTTVTATTVNLTTATFADATSQTTAFVGEARKVYVTARNNSGSTIAAGKVVYLSGATGNKPTIALAQANAEGTSARVIGLTVESIANNADGKVIISGSAENIDTSAFNAGDVVYLSASTAGGMTTTLPTQPYHGVAIGIITRANPSVGSVEVSINNYQELEELSDVLIASKANNDLLAWDSTSSTWQNKTFSTLGLLTSATAASTYQTQAGMSAYLTTSAASSTYLTQSNAASTYAPIASPTFTGTVTIPAGASISGYLTSATAASTYAPLASPALTGNPTAPTPSTSDNDTSIATTAFVNAYCPAASTTAAGKVELATDAEAITATSTTLAVTASNLEAQSFDQDFNCYEYNTWTATTSGTGATTGQTFNGKLVTAPTSATGYGLLSQGLYVALRGSNANSGFGWGKRYAVSFRLVNVGASADANSVGRVLFGKGNAVTTTGLSTRGFGIQFTVGGTLQILAHNGTALTTYSTSHTFVAATAIDVTLTVSATGTVECFVNGTSVGSTTGAPTSGATSAGNAIHLEAENIATLTGTRLSFVVQNPRMHCAVS